MLNTITRFSAVTERLASWQKLALTVAACCASAALMTPLIGHMDLANIVMVFLLVVLFVAATMGSTCAIAAAVLSVVFYDVFFVPPRFSLVVDEAQYLVTFAVMLTVGLITGQMAGGLKDKERLALHKEARTRALYGVARELAGVVGHTQVQEICEAFFTKELGVSTWILTAQDGTVDFDAAHQQPPFAVEPSEVQKAICSGTTIHSSSSAKTRHGPIYIPLQASAAVRGVLVISQSARPEPLGPDDLSLAQALGAVLAITLERLHYVAVAKQAELDGVSERLRATILSALSHDLRTPLTVIMGLAESLNLGDVPLAEPALSASRDIYASAVRLKTMVNNLLDIVRLEQGRIAVSLEWHSIEEVLGASIAYLGQSLAGHTVRVAIADDLPLVEMDAILMERVFSNLLENAAKFSPPKSVIGIEAFRREGAVHILLRDQGPGFSGHQQNSGVQRYDRGDLAPVQEGLGLGLSICHMIIAAHGGRMSLGNGPQGGAVVTLVLNLGDAPQVPQE